jgi:hypothetical protein
VTCPLSRGSNYDENTAIHISQDGTKLPQDWCIANSASGMGMARGLPVVLFPGGVPVAGTRLDKKAVALYDVSLQEI